MALDQPTGETGQIIAEFTDDAGDYAPSDIGVEPANSPELDNVSSVLKHFVASEGGATALLATAFDPECLGTHDPRRRRFCEAFANRCGAPLPKNGPSLVFTEREGMDLLMIWGEWAVVVEVKVRSSSVSDGQLQRYYERVAAQLRCGPFAGCSRILVAYLTPRNVGQKEFNSFNVSGVNDHKVVLAWEEILNDLTAIYGDGNGHIDFAGRLVVAGAAQIDELLRKARDVTPKTDWTPERTQVKEFALAVQARVEELWPMGSLRFKQPYTTPDLDLVYACLGDPALGHVHFRIDATSVVADPPRDSHVRAIVSYQAVKKERASLRPRLAAMDHCGVAAMVGVPAEQISIDCKDASITHSISATGLRDALCEQTAAVFIRFLSALRPLITAV